MKKSDLKALNIKIKPEFVRPWDTYFWCPIFQQKCTLAQCNWRQSVTGEFPVYQSCVNCEIRKHSFRLIRRPRLPQRTPRTK